MDFNFSLFFMALGLACCIEALPWLVAPRRFREMLHQFGELPSEQLRMGGFLMLALGLGVCAAGRHLM